MNSSLNANLNKNVNLHVSLDDIQKAKKELEKYLRPSPLVYNPWLSEKLGCEIYFKLESMQPIGSFKIRGATYKIARLSSDEKKRGVVAASAGNHAQGVAWGSRQLGVNACIVMPNCAPLVKLQNTKALGAEVILTGNSYDETFVAAQSIAKETKRVLIHAFEDHDIIAGQGTIGLEILSEIPDVDFVIGSVGGGGLMAGAATALKALRPQVQLVGCQAQGAPSMVQSIQKGHAVTLDSLHTFADGIAVARASEPMRQYLSQVIDHWSVVDDETIAAAVLTLLEKGKILVEGAGALPLAAAESMKDQLCGKKVVLIMSGGNIDVNLLNRIIDLGLIRSGRRIRLNVSIYDRPGSLARLTDLIGKQGGNIIQAIHDRSQPSTRIDQTDVELTLETRGPEHSATLIDALKQMVLKLELAQ